MVGGVCGLVEAEKEGGGGIMAKRLPKVDVVGDGSGVEWVSKSKKRGGGGGDI